MFAGPFSESDARKWCVRVGLRSLSEKPFRVFSGRTGTGEAHQSKRAFRTVGELRVASERVRHQVRFPGGLGRVDRDPRCERMFDVGEKFASSFRVLSCEVSESRGDSAKRFRRRRVGRTLREPENDVDGLGPLLSCDRARDERKCRVEGRRIETQCLLTDLVCTFAVSIAFRGVG